jgi:2'-5' RNA ligase
MAELIRAFLSIDIEDPHLLSRIAHIQGKIDQDAAKMKLVEQENIHFTWRFFGDTPPEKINQIRNELEGLEFSPFSIEIRGVSAFPDIRRPRVIWIGVTHNASIMVDLKRRTDDLLGNLGYPIEKKFTPHATIARVREVRDRNSMMRNLESLAEETVGTMSVDAIRMTKSTLTSSGPIYETMWEIQGKK